MLRIYGKKQEVRNAAENGVMKGTGMLANSMLRCVLCWIRESSGWYKNKKSDKNVAKYSEKPQLRSQLDKTKTTLMWNDNIKVDLIESAFNYKVR